MPTTCDVTVITAAYNCVKYLEQCVRSVQGQTLPPKEHIIVDDCSTDGTHAVATRLAAECTRVPIRVLRLSQNGGAAAARNQAIEVATTEFVGVMDADDVALPDWLALVVPELQDAADVGMVGGGIQMMDEEGTSLLLVVTHPSWKEETHHARAGTFYGSLPGLVLRRSAVISAGGFDARLRAGHDTDLVGRVVAVSRMVQVPFPVTRYRVVRSSLTSTRRGYQRAVQSLAVARTKLVCAGAAAAEIRRELAPYELRVQKEQQRVHKGPAPGAYGLRLGGLYLAVGRTRRARVAYAEAWHDGCHELRCLAGLALSVLPSCVARWLLATKHWLKSALKPYSTVLRPDQFNHWLQGAQRAALRAKGTMRVTQ